MAEARIWSTRWILSVGERGRADDLGELTGGVATDKVHLEEAVGGGDESLGEDEVVERLRVNVGNALGVALDRNRGFEAGDLQAAIQLRQRCGGGGANPMAADEVADDCGEEEDHGEGRSRSQADAARMGDDACGARGDRARQAELRRLRKRDGAGGECLRQFGRGLEWTRRGSYSSGFWRLMLRLSLNGSVGPG